MHFIVPAVDLYLTNINKILEQNKKLFVLKKCCFDSSTLRPMAPPGLNFEFRKTSNTENGSTNDFQMAAHHYDFSAKTLTLSTFTHKNKRKTLHFSETEQNNEHFLIIFVYVTILH